jgi:hypothetical protein
MVAAHSYQVSTNIASREQTHRTFTLNYIRRKKRKSWRINLPIMTENPNLSLVGADDHSWYHKGRIQPKMSVPRELVQLVWHPRSLGFVLEQNSKKFAIPRDDSRFREIIMPSGVFESVANSGLISETQWQPKERKTYLGDE